MLQLALKQGEYVMIGDNVKVCYDRLGIHKQIFLSFDAPKDVKILRQRVHEEILLKEAGADTPEGQIVAAQLEAMKEDRERAVAARAERNKEKVRAKKEVRNKELQNKAWETQKEDIAALKSN